MRRSKNKYIHLSENLSIFHVVFFFLLLYYSRRSHERTQEDLQLVFEELLHISGTWLLILFVYKENPNNFKNILFIVFQLYHIYPHQSKENWPRLLCLKPTHKPAQCVSYMNLNILYLYHLPYLLNVSTRGCAVY
jgi:hypothetical protein